MTRSEIRYSLGRVKSGTADKKHLAVLDAYKTQLDEFDLTISEFTEEWDIDKSDTSKIVTGKVAKKLNKEKSLFDSKGIIKE
jgi:predicted transcriptional regulator